MTWDGSERRTRRHNGSDPVTNDDLDEALAVHSEQERAYVKGLHDSVMSAFPEGIEKHRQAHNETIDDIAEKAAEKAIEKLTGDVYKAVGKSVVSKFLWLLGVVTVTAYLYLKKTGLIV